MQKQNARIEQRKAEKKYQWNKTNPSVSFYKQENKQENCCWKF